MMNRDMDQAVRERLAAFEVPPNPALPNPVSADSAWVKEVERENRTLRWKLKTLGKQLGKASERVHQLRTENATLRAMLQITPRDHLSALERQRAAEAEVIRLREKLEAADEPVPYVPVADAAEDHHTPTRDQDA